jgi:hypothetical protein
VHEDGEPVFATPEEAAAIGIPRRFVTILGVRRRGNEADVWMLTNDRPPYEREEASCTRVGDGWELVNSGGGFGAGTPPEIIEKARALGG